MQKPIIIWKRRKARELRENGLSMREIAEKISASKNSVCKWVKMEEDKVEMDNRGKVGDRLKYTKEHEQRVIKIRRELEEGNSYFYGIKVVKQNYKHKYKNDIGYWFVYDVLKKNGMIHGQGVKRKGKSKYMNYPQRKLSKCGKTVMAMDFIGPRYIKEKSEGINFLSLKYLRPQKYGIVKRVEGQTTNEVIKILTEVFQDHPIPDVMKMDNDSAFGATLRYKKTIGRATKFLLSIGVRPMYVAPSSPWNNGSVEGYNSVFGKKFWKALSFEDEEEIDVEIKKFNIEYRKYCSLVNNNPKISKPRYLKRSDLENYKSGKNDYKEKIIYFLRIVRRKGEKGTDSEKGYINILKEDIYLDKSYINTFTFCELDLERNRLRIGIQKEDKMDWIKTKKFVVTNVPRSDLS